MSTMIIPVKNTVKGSQSFDFKVDKGFLEEFGNDFILTSTAGVLTSLPPVLIALIFQKYIISGLSSGAVKG